MIKTITPELISQLWKYKRILEEVRAKWYDLEYWKQNPVSASRLKNIWKELRQSIQELNNYLK